jgi:hypothetical protein
MPALVRLSLSFEPHEPGLRAFGLGTGELGKLLGNKWKELDDDEKKVSVCPLNNIHTRPLYSSCPWSCRLVPTYPCLLVIVHVELDVMLTDSSFFFLTALHGTGCARQGPR